LQCGLAQQAAGNEAQVTRGSSMLISAAAPMSSVPATSPPTRIASNGRPPRARPTTAEDAFMEWVPSKGKRILAEQYVANK
jgi:hypothetical protein